MSIWSGTNELTPLVGTTIQRIVMDDNTLAFWTDKGEFVYVVDGDCCSYSYFYDFIGVRHLLDNGPVTEVQEVQLQEGDPGFLTPKNHDLGGGGGHDEVEVYGYRLTTTHPIWGEVSSVFSFRNDSNGWYGGMLLGSRNDASRFQFMCSLTEDVLDANWPTMTDGETPR